MKLKKNDLLLIIVSTCFAPVIVVVNSFASECEISCSHFSGPVASRFLSVVTVWLVIGVVVVVVSVVVVVIVVVLLPSCFLVVRTCLRGLPGDGLTSADKLSSKTAALPWPATTNWGPIPEMSLDLGEARLLGLTFGFL